MDDTESLASKHSKRTSCGMTLQGVARIDWLNINPQGTVIWELGKAGSNRLINGMGGLMATEAAIYWVQRGIPLLLCSRP